MKRFHVHVAVDDLTQSIRFYSTLFASEPSVVEADYAKWMLEDPRLNFAISARGNVAGIQHLGIQVEDERELAEVFDRLSRAEAPVVEEKNVTCCYAKGDKQWIADPQRVAWETFLTHGRATVYGAGVSMDTVRGSGICCEPKAAAPSCGTAKAESATSGCCV